LDNKVFDIIGAWCNHGVHWCATLANISHKSTN